MKRLLILIVLSLLAGDPQADRAVPPTGYTAWLTVFTAAARRATSPILERSAGIHSMRTPGASASTRAARWISAAKIFYRSRTLYL